MARTGSLRPNPVLVYLVTQDWYFMAHRVPMALAAQRAGYDVHVITHIDKHRAAIEALGFRRACGGLAAGEHRPVCIPE